MASDINHVVLVGRLTRDPELRMAGSSSLAAFSIASNRSYTHNGERREETLFMDCTAWGRLSEIIKQYCQKGKQVAVTGRLKQNVWTNQEGKKQSKIELVVENLQLLGGRMDGGGGGGGMDYAAADYSGGSYGQAPAPSQNPMGGQPGGGGMGGGAPEHFSEDDIPF